MATVFGGLLVIASGIKGVVYVMNRLSNKVETDVCQKTKDDLYDKFNTLTGQVNAVAIQGAAIKTDVANIKEEQSEVKETVGKIWDKLQEA